MIHHQVFKLPEPQTLAERNPIGAIDYLTNFNEELTEKQWQLYHYAQFILCMQFYGHITGEPNA